MDKFEIAKKFEPKGHPGSLALDQRQKMLWLRIEIIFKDLAVDLIDYTNNNKEREDALDLLLKTRDMALASVRGDQKANSREAQTTKSDKLVADGYDGLNKKGAGHEETETQKALAEIRSEATQKKPYTGKKRGRKPKAPPPPEVETASQE